MLQLIEQIHHIANKLNLELTPEKTFFMLLTVKYLSHEIGVNTGKTIESKIDSNHKVPSLSRKKELIRFIGSTIFHPKSFDKLHNKMRPLFGSLPDNIETYWNIELETLFQQIKPSTTKNVTLTLPKTNNPFVITADSPQICIGYVLFQMNNKGKLDFISYSSRILFTNERKVCTTYREILGILFSLTKKEDNKIGSVHFNNVLNDHKQNLSCFKKTFSNILHCTNAINQVSKTSYYKKLGKKVL